MTGLRFAISFLTIFPVASKDSEAGVASSRAYFPLVGLLLGAIIAGLDLLIDSLLAPILASALLVVALILLTRALHIDGFMDSCDGLFGGFGRERRLEIMRDPRVGSFAVIGCVSLLMIKWAAILGLPPQFRTPLLVLFPCISRWGMLLNMEVYPYARTRGMGTSFHEGTRIGHVAIGLAITVTASILLAGVAGIVMLLVASGVALVFGRWVTALLGGMTGDTYGATNEIGEVALLLTAIAITWAAPILPQSPFVFVL